MECGGFVERRPKSTTSRTRSRTDSRFSVVSDSFPYLLRACLQKQLTEMKKTGGEAALHNGQLRDDYVRGHPWWQKKYFAECWSIVSWRIIGTNQGATTSPQQAVAVAGAEPTRTRTASSVSTASSEDDGEERALRSQLMRLLSNMC